MSAFLLNDDAFIFKFALGMLVVVDKKMSEDLDQVAGVMNNIAKHIEYSQVIRIAEEIKISIQNIEKLRVRL
jgi:hypothetical protein